MSVNIKTSVKMDKIQKREMEGILDIGEVLFVEGIRDKEITWKGVQYEISQWFPEELNALTIQKKMNNPYSEPTILKYAKKGERMGFFHIWKCKDLNNADMISLTWWGGCSLFCNNRIGIEDFALFLDGWERLMDKRREIEAKNKGEDYRDKLRSAFREAGWLDNDISIAIEDMKEASEQNHNYNLISCLNREDRALLERDLRNLVKSYLMPFEYELKRGSISYGYEEDIIKDLSHFISMSLSREPEEIGEKALRELIKEREEEGRGIMYLDKDTIINISYRGVKPERTEDPFWE